MDRASKVGTLSAMAALSGDDTQQALQCQFLNDKGTGETPYESGAYQERVHFDPSYLILSNSNAKRMVAGFLK